MTLISGRTYIIIKSSCQQLEATEQSLKLCSLAVMWRLPEDTLRQKVTLCRSLSFSQKATGRKSENVVSACFCFCPNILSSEKRYFETTFIRFKENQVQSCCRCCRNLERVQTNQSSNVRFIFFKLGFLKWAILYFRLFNTVDSKQMLSINFCR